MAALLAGDLDGVMADYTEDSVFIAQGRQARGLDAIRAGYQRLMEGGPFTHGTFELTVDDEQIAGEIGYLVWHADCKGVAMPFATDTFVVRDGKITAQTVAVKVEPKG
jgi:ketosteroid isomerase-like protein